MKGRVSVTARKEAAPVTVVALGKEYEIRADVEKPKSDVEIAVAPENKAQPISFVSQTGGVTIKATPVVAPVPVEALSPTQAAAPVPAPLTEEIRLEPQKPVAATVPASQPAPMPVPVVEAAPAPLPPVEISNKWTPETARLARTEGIEVSLRWPETAGAKSYLVKVTASDGTVITTTESTRSGVMVTLDPRQGTDYRYEVTTRMESGDLKKSRPAPIQVKVAPPEPGQPKNGARSSSKRGVLITWSRAAFSETYLLQVAGDREFGQSLQEHGVKKNFLYLRNIPAGRYYWRVATELGPTRSDWSQPQSFEVTP